MSSIKCLERALDILELMYNHGGKMTLTEISNDLSLYKSTVLRTLATLAEKDFVHRDEYTGVYSLGSKVFMLGMVAASSLPLSKIAKPQLTYLSEKYDEYANLSILDKGIKTDDSITSSNDQFVIIFQQYLNDSFTNTLITPSQCENSDVFLPPVYMCFITYSTGDLNLQVHLDKINKRSISHKWDLDDFTKELDIIRENGYVLQEVDHRTGQVCIAAPIFNKENEFLGTLSILVSKSKLNKYTAALIIEDITQSAEIISKQSRRNI